LRNVEKRSPHFHFPLIPVLPIQLPDVLQDHGMVLQQDAESPVALRIDARIRRDQPTAPLGRQDASVAVEKEQFCSGLGGSRRPVLQTGAVDSDAASFGDELRRVAVKQLESTVPARAADGRAAGEFQGFGNPSTPMGQCIAP
jgi:hypothetical protein